MITLCTAVVFRASLRATYAWLTVDRRYATEINREVKLNRLYSKLDGATDDSGGARLFEVVIDRNYVKTLR
jgi:hypothetical protein